MQAAPETPVTFDLFVLTPAEAPAPVVAAQERAIAALKGQDLPTAQRAVADVLDFYATRSEPMPARAEALAELVLAATAQ